MLRKSEILCNEKVATRMHSKGLREKDIVFKYHGPGKGGSVSLCIRSSKTDQAGKGEVRVRTSVASPVCVVKALSEWKMICAEEAGSPEAPAFRQRDGSPYGIRWMMELFGRTTGGRLVTPHCLRVGGASSLYAGGIDIMTIMREGRWTSSAVHRYLWEMWGSGEEVSKVIASTQVEVIEEEGGLFWCAPKSQQ